MPKQQYRTGLGIISDILLVTMEGGREGVLISTLATKANLSNNVAMEKCQELIEIGLIKTTRRDRNRILVITEKGIHFLRQMHKFIETLKEVKIRF